MAENSLLGKLDGLVSRFEEVGTLITDPAVIADLKRFVKLNKEYRDLEKIVGARSEYVKVLNGIEEAKALLSPSKIRKCGKWLVKSWMPATNVFPLWRRDKIIARSR